VERILSPMILFGVTSAVLFSMALYGVLVSSNVLRKLIAINVMGSSVFLLLVAMANRVPEEPDPVPQAMVLTGIIVTVGTTGLAVNILRRRVADGHSAHLFEETADPSS
jgi:multicomponent Na+:H+ antiporter subunit C